MKNDWQIIKRAPISEITKQIDRAIKEFKVKFGEGTIRFTFDPEIEVETINAIKETYEHQYKVDLSSSTRRSLRNRAGTRLTNLVFHILK